MKNKAQLDQAKKHIMKQAHISEGRVKAANSFSLYFSLDQL